MLTRRGWIIGAGSLGVSALLPAARGMDWPQFRGADRSNVSKETGLFRKWPTAGPKLLWSVPVEPRAMPAPPSWPAASITTITMKPSRSGRSTAALWPMASRSGSSAKPREIRPNHAITRTIPAVDGRFVCSLDPKAVLHCLDARTGKANLAQEPGHRIQGHHPLLVQRAVPAAGSRPGDYRRRRRGHSGSARQGHRQGNLAHAQPGAVLDDARFGDAGRAGRSQAISLWNAGQGPLGVSAEGRQAVVGIPAQVQRGGGAFAHRGETTSGSS
jgi:hypothetical protein